MLNAEANFIIHHSLGASCSIQDAWDWSQSGYPKKIAIAFAGNDSAPPFHRNDMLHYNIRRSLT